MMNEERRARYKARVGEGEREREGERKLIKGERETERFTTDKE